MKSTNTSKRNLIPLIRNQSPLSSEARPLLDLKAMDSEGPENSFQIQSNSSQESAIKIKKRKNQTFKISQADQLNSFDKVAFSSNYTESPKNSKLTFKRTNRNP